MKHGFDVVMASRRIKGAEVATSQPIYRILLGNIYILLSKFILQSSVQDYNCGFKLYKRAAAQIIFPKLTMDNWSFDSELIFLISKFNLSAVEVPVKWVDQSKPLRLDPCRMVSTPSSASLRSDLMPLKRSMTKTPALHSPLTFTSTCTFLLLCAITSAHASSIGSTKISFNTGKKSQTSGIEERELGGYFSYYKYGVKVTAEPTDGFSYRIGIEDYHKNFDPKRDNLDNQTNLYNAYFSMPIYKSGNSAVSFNTNYKLRTKRYKKFTVS